MDTHTPTQEATHTFILTASAIGRAHAHIWRAGRPLVPGLQPISALTDKDVLPSDARSGFHWRKRCRGVRLLNINRSAPEAHTWGYYQIKTVKNSSSLEAQTDLTPGKCALHMETLCCCFFWQFLFSRSEPKSKFITGWFIFQNIQCLGKKVHTEIFY